MNTYDLTVVLDGKTTAAKKKTATEKIEGLIKTFEGSVGEIKDWGEKDLAYKIGKSDKGIYLTLPVELSGEGAKRLNDKIRLEEYILRYLLVKTNPKKVEELVAGKKLDKETKKTKAKVEVVESEPVESVKE